MAIRNSFAQNPEKVKSAHTLPHKTCTIYKLYISLSKMLEVMNFEDITGDGCLWAVRYAGDPDNILAMTFEKWNDQD